MQLTKKLSNFKKKLNASYFNHENAKNWDQLFIIPNDTKRLIATSLKGLR